MDNNTFKRRVCISLEPSTDDLLNKVKDYPKWRGNKSAIVEEALLKFLREDENNGK